MTKGLPKGRNEDSNKVPSLSLENGPAFLVSFLQIPKGSILGKRFPTLAKRHFFPIDLRREGARAKTLDGTHAPRANVIFCLWLGHSISHENAVFGRLLEQTEVHGRQDKVLTPIKISVGKTLSKYLTAYSHCRQKAQFHVLFWAGSYAA